MSDVLAFWIAALAIAATGYLIGASALRRLPDAGAGLSFPLGMLLTGLAYFLLRTFDVLPAGRGGAVAALAIVALVGVAVAGRDRWLLVTWHRSWRGVVVAVGLFTFAFFAYTTFRSYNADIGGTEQPMDFLFLNAAMVSPEYPPQDPWMAGERISYYYFGYVQMGVLTSVSGVPASTGYNLSLAYTFAASATAMASLAFALARWVLGARRLRWAIVAGGLSVVLLLFVGSLSAIFEWGAAHGRTNQALYEAFGVESLLPCEPGQVENCYSGPMNPRTSEWYPTEFWFWWKGTRLIPDTITEFPFFSFLLGDLHPHVMSIPLALLAIGFAAATWRGRGVLDWRRLRREPVPAVLLAVVFGALAFQNAWDAITFSTVLGAAALARNLRAAPTVRATVAAAGYLAPVALAAVVIYSPWWLTFGSQAGGLFAYTGEGTRPAHALLQFGPVLLAGILALGLVSRRTSSRLLTNAAVGAAWVPVLPFILWLVRASTQGDLSEAVDSRTAEGWVTLALYGMAVWLLATAAVVLAIRRHPGAIVATVGALGALLLFGAELFYIRDVFAGNLPRLNTVFKLSYQAWIMLSLAGGVALAYTFSKLPRWQALPAVPVLLLVVGGLVYPLLASFNRTNGFNNPTRIDGLAAVAQSDPSEYALIRWIAANTRPDDVIFETTGRRWARGQESALTIVNQNVDYTNAGRISGRTGRPTPIGWYFHQVQWRGDTEPIRSELGRRQGLVDGAYTASNGADVVDAMRQFGARYLVVGREELANYAGLMPDYAQFMNVAFEAGPYRIYSLPELRSIKT